MGYQSSDRPDGDVRPVDNARRTRASRFWFAWALPLLLLGSVSIAACSGNLLDAGRLMAAVNPQVNERAVAQATITTTATVTPTVTPSRTPTVRAIATAAGARTPGVIIIAPDTATPTRTATPGGSGLTGRTPTAPAVATVSLVTNTPTRAVATAASGGSGLAGGTPTAPALATVSLVTNTPTRAVATAALSGSTPAGGTPTAPAVATVSLVTNTPTRAAATATLSGSTPVGGTPTAPAVATVSLVTNTPTLPAPAATPTPTPTATSLATPAATVTTGAQPSILTPVVTATSTLQIPPSILTPVTPTVEVPPSILTPLVTIPPGTIPPGTNPPVATVSLVTNTPTPTLVVLPPTFTPTITPTATSTLTPTPSPTATDFPTLVITNTFLYTGPGIQFTVVAPAPRGTVIVVVGQTLDGDWYVVDSGYWIQSDMVGNAPVDPVVVTPQAQAAVSVQVSGGAYALRDANLRSGPGLEYPIEGGVKAGKPLTIVSTSADGEWYMLEGGCWIAAFLVGNALPGLVGVGSQSASVTGGISPAVVAPAPEYNAVVFSAANLYTGPGLQYPVATRVPQGELVTLVAQTFDGNWYLLDNGYWIASFMVDIVQPEGVLIVPIAPPTLPPPRAIEIPVVVPTSTPIVVQPVATLTPAEQEYVADLTNVLAGYSTALTQLEQQTAALQQNSLLIVDGPWLERTYDALALLRTQNQAVRDLQAPPRFSAVQAEMLVAAGHYDTAATFLTEAVEELDLNKGMLAAKEIESGNAAIERAKALMQVAVTSTAPPSVLTPVPIAPAPVPVAPTPTATVTQGLQPSPQTCDPSYPTVCIPPPPPTLNCEDIGFSNFEVIGSDPHGFDGNDNGFGCE